MLANCTDMLSAPGCVTMVRHSGMASTRSQQKGQLRKKHADGPLHQLRSLFDRVLHGATFMSMYDLNRRLVSFADDGDA